MTSIADVALLIIHEFTILSKMFLIIIIYKETSKQMTILSISI